MYRSRTNRQERIMTYLPWAGSLQSDHANDPADPERADSAHGSRSCSSDGCDGSDGPRDGDGHASRDDHDASELLPRQPRPDRGGRFPAARLADPGAVGQEISSRLFSAGCDLHFAMMTVREGPGRQRLEHAVQEIDEAIRELRHLMLAIMERLA
jgi:hypothetical protein